ncbi:hypothetical protein B0A54_15256 [Friedmanniomyces endolithicus]|uniref:AB hydrolase-1 domain-containing protein n=1 Tax=Friedmanniomyces endolithicus TaxID=329885 RepID=A0A4U0UG25_9PEZI|nr:hypothetical protein B0A54_15256 [Friedmanniomyces endolithicus]
MAAIDKLTPNDSRIQHDYLDIAAQTPQKGTVVLVHGWPDISLAWRYQIPLLSSLGFRCIALDCMGYGETGTSSRLSDFTYRTHAEAISGIAKAIGAHRIILGGHDWGGMVVYRAAQWLPELVSHVFSVATPYMGVQERYVSNEELVKGPLPQFQYQVQLSSEEEKVEKVVQGEVRMRRFLTGMYGGKAKSGRVALTPEYGVDLEMVADESDAIAPSPLFNEEEMDYYVKQFLKNGIHGPCNWYRTRKLNHEDDQQLPDPAKSGVQQPVLFIQALYDNVLKPEMSKGMERSIKHLTRGEVPASHWALWHTPQKTNKLIKDWVEGVVLGGKSKL